MIFFQLKKLFEKNNVTLRHLKDAVTQFDRSASDFMAKLAKANVRNPMEIRIINDQLMQLERVFLMVRLILNFCFSSETEIVKYIFTVDQNPHKINWVKKVECIFV